MIDKTKGWKIDYRSRIIYVNSVIEDVQILGLITDISTNKKGLPSGPGKMWRIIVVDN